MLDSIALMNGINQKMNYLQARQRVLAQNISNSDSPNYQAMDLKAPDFKKTMSRYIDASTSQINGGEKLTLATTSPGQVTHFQSLGRADAGTAVEQTYETTPIMNSVNVEEQMMQTSNTAGDYQLATNLYNKNLNLLRSAIKN